MKHLVFGLCLVWVLGQAAAARAQVGADLCGNAPTVGAGTFDPLITNANAPIAANPDGGYSLCGLTVQQVTLSGNDSSQAYQRDVWFRYVPTPGFDGFVQIDGISCPSRGLNVSVLSSCGGTELQCAPNACNVPLTFPASAGAGPYLVRVASYGNTSFDGGQQSPVACRVRFIELSSIAGQAGESCSHPRTISAAGSPYLLHWTTPSTEALSISCSPNDSGRNALWFSYTATLTGNATIAVGDNVGSPAASNDSRIIFTGYASCGGEEVVGMCDPSGAPGRLTFHAVAGQTYLIRAAAAHNGFLGQRTLTVTEAAAPVNDTCSGATLVTGSYTSTFTDTGATANPPFCNCGYGNSLGQRDIWYHYVASRAGTTSIDVKIPLNGGFPSGQNLDTTIAVFTSCSSPDFFEIACAARGGQPDGSSGTPRWWACFDVPTAGSSYWIRIARSISSYELTPPYPGTIRIREFANRPDDSCAGATQIGSGTFNWDSSGAHDDGVPQMYSGCGNSVTNGAIWFKYIPPQTGFASFQTGMQPGHETDFIDTILEAYTGTCGELSLVDCNDNRNGGQNPPDRVSLLAGVPATVGVPIYLRLGINLQGGNSNYYYEYGTLTAGITPPPPGDECSAPVVVPPAGATLTFDTTYATRNPLDPSYGCSPPDPAAIGHDVWFSWTPSTSGRVILDTCGIEIGDQLYNTTLAVYNTCSGAAVDCDDNSGVFAHDFLAHCTNAQSYTEFDATPNVTYLIRVGGGPAGRGRLHVDFTPNSFSGQLGSAIVPAGTGPLDFVSGSITSRSQVDVYKIHICDPSSFTARTQNSVTGATNTALYLFTLDGHGIAFNDDDGFQGEKYSRLFPPSFMEEGDYYLAVTTGTHYLRTHGAHGRMPVSVNGLIWNPEPRTDLRAPDGPGADGIVVGWTGAGDYDAYIHPAPAPYRVEFTGVCRVPGCRADFDHSGQLSVQDIFAFLNAWFAGTADADFDGMNGLQVQDIFAFLNAWFAGCP